jgi:Zn-dependent protease with chaperone function
MSFLGMGFAFAAIGFVVANAAMSLITLVLWRTIGARVTSARSIFLVRMLPTIGSIGFVLACALPAFLVFEPRGTAERPGLALSVMVSLAAALVVAGLYRTFVSWLHTRRLEQMWRAVAVDTQSLGRSTYRVSSELPFVALVGVLRPRLFVSDRFFDALTAGERRAVLEHEEAHRRSLDNLKRAGMRLAPDCLGLSHAGRDIERAWALAAEREADDHAAGLGRARSLDLAGALLKAARATPMPRAFASSFCDGTIVAHRIERLLDDAPARRAPTLPVALRWAAVVAGLDAVLVLWEPTLRLCYGATETVIRLFQ